MSSFPLPHVPEGGVQNSGSHASRFCGSQHFVDMIAGYLFRCLVNCCHILLTPDELSLFCIKVVTINRLDLIGLAGTDAKTVINH